MPLVQNHKLVNNNCLGKTPSKVQYITMSPANLTVLIHTMIHPTAHLEYAHNTCTPPQYVQRADMRESSNS